MFDEYIVAMQNCQSVKTDDTVKTHSGSHNDSAETICDIDIDFDFDDTLAGDNENREWIARYTSWLEAEGLM